MPRQLTNAEIDELLTGDHLARLATVDVSGYPHVTPLWFLWEGGVFHLASDAHRPHVGRIRLDARAGIVIDTEEPERSDGERPNRQVRVIGDAVLTPDFDGSWTARIWAKYQRQSEPGGRAQRLLHRQRVHIVVRPRHTVAVASV